MKEINENYQCPIFSEFRPGSCLRDMQSTRCPLYRRKGDKEYCSYEEYQLRRKTEHSQGSRLRVT